MLTVAEIRRTAYDSAYRKGKEYYGLGRVKKIDVRWPSTGHGSTRAEGEVRGSGRRVYFTMITVDEEDFIEDYTCECPAYDNYWGMCKHCVALAFALQMEQKKKNSEPVRPVLKSDRATTEELSVLLHQYAVRGRMHRLGGLDQEIDLECYFQSDRNGLLLEMKLGGKRKYVVKNLVKLVRDVQEMREVVYGSSLRFVHDRSAFTEDARELLVLLERAIAVKQPDYRETVLYENSANFRYLLLRGESLEGFLTHFLGQTIRLDEQDFPVKEGDPKLVMKLEETVGGAEIRVEALQVFEGSEHSFVKKDGVLWRVSEGFAESVLPAWMALQRTQGGMHFRNRTIFLSRADYGRFCASLMPRLSPYVEIDSGKLDLAAFVPPEPEFALYLGLAAEDVIEAAARVRYDDREYDLLQDGAAMEGRNLERELELRGLIRKYFREPKQQDASARKKARAMMSWLEDMPVRDLDEDDGRGFEWDLFDGSGEYGMPVRDLDEDLKEAEAEAEDSEGLPDGYHRLAASGEEELYRLLEEGIPALSEEMEMFVDASIRRMSIRPAPKVTMGIGISGELIDLDVQVEGMDPEEISAILGAYNRKKKFYRLRSGDFISLTESGLGDLAELSDGLGLTGKELSSGKVKLPLYRALYLEGVLRDSEQTQVRRLPEYRGLIRSMKSFSDSDFELPDGLHAQLRRYQRDGFRWLCTLWENGFGGILADDMGLGKTLQMIALLLYRKGQAGSALVVAPASLLFNWESEVRRFAPDLTVQVIAGTAQERKEQIAAAMLYDVNITSYDLLKRDTEFYQELSFGCCIVDEAQYIKNAGTQAAKAVKTISAAHRFAMTGTPIENRLSDLWSIFDFLMPGYLFAYRKFREELEAPIVKNGDEELSRRLQRLVTPFILRRRKEDVLKDLPEKLTETVTVAMTPEQDRIYRASRDRLLNDLLHKNEQEVRESRIQILAELTKLRQICCSPELCYENYTGGSGKVDACLELMKNAVEGGHRVLVFSQFTSMLELLQREWRETGMEYRYLSGKDSKLARKQMVEDFQTGEIPVFFISLKAGGTGLNLTAADIVIHVDPWWNVAAQNQATDRAHRIGQKQVVSVMKLVARNTIEEKIIALQEKKAALADSVVEGEGVRDTALNREELLSLF